MFPLGILPYLVGGLLIGLGVSFIYVLTGIHATQSSLLSTTLSYVSHLPYFQRRTNRASREWRLIFAAGVLVGAFIYTLTLSPDGFFVTSVQW